MKIKAIIVTYNGLKWIDKCFGSLYKSETPLEIIAIDNGSVDGSVEKIKKTFPRLK